MVKWVYLIFKITDLFQRHMDDRLIMMMFLLLNIYDHVFFSLLDTNSAK